MEVLLAILGDGDSSRLYQRLVEQEQAAVDVGTQFDAGFDPGLAWVYAVVPPGGDVTRTEKLIDEEIARLAQEGPTPVEITKARNQALVGFWHGLETISGKAQALGDYEVRKIYVERESLEERGIKPADLMQITFEDEKEDYAEKPLIQVVDRGEMTGIMAQQDVILSF